MKKIISCMLLFAMLFSFAIAGASFAEEKKISVVTTIFPIYDWVREVAGDKDNVEIAVVDTLAANKGKHRAKHKNTPLQ